ncbi:MAG: hypothetical protein GX232_02720 [Acholeplasmataceae bacterium]|nr:hypothetical protein [Acholeplasmataceae bacterium]
MNKPKFKFRKGFVKAWVLILTLMLGLFVPGFVVKAVGIADYYDDKPYHYNQEADGHFASDYATLSEAHEGGRLLNQEIMAESITMLKNEGGTLPLNNDVKNISVFGKHSTDFAHIVRANPRQTMDTKTASLEDSLVQAGFNINPHIAPFYRNYPYPEFTFTHPEIADPVTITSQQYKDSPLQPPVSEFTYDITNSLRKYSDAALVVLGNRGAQANLYSRNYAAGSGTSQAPSAGAALANYSDPNDYYNNFYMLNQSEKDLINYVASNFTNVIVLINSSEVWDIKWLNDHKGVDTFLYMDAPGADGILALGRILNGEVNPSGRLINMFVTDQRNNPQWQNFGDGLHILDGPDGKTGKSLGSINYYTNPEFDFQSTGNKQNSFQNYSEGIYLGSKYYETRGWEMGGKSGTSANQYNDGDWSWYDENVVYPLGHGLSYTDFKWELVESTPANGAVLNKEDKITLKVRVTNIGYVPGKDVVQLYYTAPYKAGGVEKAFVNLAGFEKTRILNPGQSEVLTIELMAQNMASYDWNNLSGLGKNSYDTWGAYVLEQGNYQLRLMRNANVRSEQLVIEYTVDSTSTGYKAAEPTNSAGVATIGGGIMYETDVDTGKRLENRFSVNDPVSGEGLRMTAGLSVDDATTQQYGVFNGYSDSMVVFSRQHFGDANPASFPTPVTPEQRVASQVIVDALLTAFSPNDPTHGDVATQPWMIDFLAENPTGKVPDNWTQATDDTVTPTIKFKDMVGVEYSDPKWDQFLNQLTWDELIGLTVNSGSYGSGSSERFEKPKGSAPDGAHGLSGSAGDNYGGDVVQGRGTVHPAPGAITMTWSKSLMYKNGRQMGAESRLAGNNNLYTVTFDVRRHSFDTRVWEGCSEDPYLIGTRGMLYVRGAQDLGTMVQIKHFLNYNGGPMMNAAIGYRYMTEQTFREIYLEPFRKAVVYNKERNYGGGALALMVAVSGLGVTPFTQNYATLTGVLRGEWGFQGWVTQDFNRPAAGPTNIVINLHQTLRAGSDQFMGFRPNNATLPGWDATLREGKGNVVLKPAAAIPYGDPTGENPIYYYGIAEDQLESHASYWFWRSSAKRVFYAELLSNVLSSSAYYYKDAYDAFMSTDGQEIAINQGSAPASNTSVALSAEGAATLPANSVVTYRLAQGEKLPAGLEFTPWGEIRRETSDSSHPANGTVANQANNAQGAWLRESFTKPITIKVEMLIDNQVRARKSIIITTTSLFVIGDGFAEGENINTTDVDNPVNMSTPYSSVNLVVGQPFSGQIQGAKRSDFHVAVTTRESDWQNVQGTNGRETTFRLIDGNLPAGLTLNKDGSITGTPTSIGETHFTIEAHRRIFGQGREILSVDNDIFLIHGSMIVSPDLEVINGLINVALDANAKGFLTNETATTLINSLTADFVTASQVTTAIDAALEANEKGFLTNETATTLINTIVNGKGYQTESQVQSLIAFAIDALELGMKEEDVQALVATAIEEAEVPEIREDGYWYIDGKNTGISTVPEEQPTGFFYGGIVVTFIIAAASLTLVVLLIKRKK